MAQLGGGGGGGCHAEEVCDIASLQQDACLVLHPLPMQSHWLSHAPFCTTLEFDNNYFGLPHVTIMGISYDLSTDKVEQSRGWGVLILVIL